MIDLLFALTLNASPAAAETFTAARNISERLEGQGNKVGSCTDVGIFTATRRALDGDHEYLGFQGVTAAGVPFLRAKEFGSTTGRWPRVRLASDGSYVVYTYRRYPFELDAWGNRRVVLYLYVDDQGRIVDLRVPRGKKLCSGEDPSTIPLTRRNKIP